MKKIFLSILAFSFASLILFSCSGVKKDKKGREDFSVFIDKFYSDIEFQLSRIDFPITGKVQENGIPELIEKEDWVILKPVEKNNPEYVVQNIEIADDLIKQQIIVKQSFSIEMEFSLNKASNEWYLTSYTGVSGVAATPTVDSTLLDSTRTVRVVHPDSLKNEK